MIGAPQGLQDGLIHPLVKYSSILLPLLTQLQTFYINIYSEAKHWEKAQSGALHLYPQVCLADQRCHGITQLIYPTWKGLGRLHALLPHCDQSPSW